MLADVAGDGGFQVGDRLEDATPQPPAGEGGEEALDGVQPGGRGRSEVEHPAGMPRQPGRHLRMLVGGVVVEDRVNHLAGRHRALDGIQEADELLMPVLRHAAADDLAFEDVQGGEQRRRAVALVVVGHRPAAAGLQRQARLGAVERLDLALLVDRQHHRVPRRIEIQPDDILDLGGESGIGRLLEGADAVRLQPVCRPDPLHRPQRDADRPGRGASRPVRRLARRLGARQRQDLRHRPSRQRRLAGRPRLVAQQALDTRFREPLLPAPDRRPADADGVRHRQHRQTLGRQQDDARPLRVCPGGS